VIYASRTKRLISQAAALALQVLRHSHAGLARVLTLLYSPLLIWRIKTFINIIGAISGAIINMRECYVDRTLNIVQEQYIQELSSRAAMADRG